MLELPEEGLAVAAQSSFNEVFEIDRSIKMTEQNEIPERILVTDVITCTDAWQAPETTRAALTDPQPATDGLGKVREALQGLLHWSHWANQKLGFDLEPKFPEYAKAKEALAILDQQTAHNPWQPIETAPRDGTLVLVWSDELYMKPYIAWWGVDQNAPEDGNEQEEWLTGDGDSWSTGYYYTPCNPTHWMPLPAPPQAD